MQHTSAYLIWGQVWYSSQNTGASDWTYSGMEMNILYFSHDHQYQKWEGPQDIELMFTKFASVKVWADSKDLLIQVNKRKKKWCELVWVASTVNSNPNEPYTFYTQARAHTLRERETDTYSTHLILNYILLRWDFSCIDISISVALPFYLPYRWIFV